MSSLHVVTRPSSQPVQPDPLLNALVARNELVGIDAMSGIQIGGVVSTVGLQGVVGLSQAVDAAFRVSPMGEDHYRAILAAYGTLVVSEIQALGMRRLS
jgi:hypothetical protein